MPLFLVKRDASEHMHRVMKRNIDQSGAMQVTDHADKHGYIVVRNSLKIIHPHHQRQAVNPCDILVLLLSDESCIPIAEFIKLPFRAEQVFLILIHLPAHLKILKVVPERL